MPETSHLGSPISGRPAVFLDRDGVINAMVYNAEFGLVDSPGNPDEFELLPGVAEAVRQINALGFLAVVVSNQPGIAKGKFTPALLDATTGKMHAALAQHGARLDGVYYCLHHPQAVVPEYHQPCECRKPCPGLLFQAARDLGIDLAASYMVGDGISDVAAGHAAGVQTLFVSSRKCYICEELAHQRVRPDFMVRDLPEALKVIRLARAGDRAGLEPYLFHGLSYGLS